MESRINYIIVGVFVVLFSIGLAGFAFWLEKYGTQEDFKYYMTYMKESVSGLSLDASVKYRGVDVGTVKNIRINPENSEEVELLLRVKKETPIKEDMAVILKFYGLTGLAFIEIEGGSKTSALLKSQNDEIPIIKSVPSIYTRLNESLPVIAQRLSLALGKIDALLSDENLANIRESIDNIKEISLYIKNYKDDLDTLIKQGVVMEGKVISSFDKVADAADKVKHVASDIEKSLQRGDYNIKEMSSPTFQQTNELLDELKALSAELEEMVLSLQRNPRDIFLKQTTPKLGPGEGTDDE
ncbi:MAG: MlaD family protein [Bacteroidales bacterium]|jgi:phospholipid/cholesterol/gamma-HCH transport system substrate-binding protein|nr:MlaD family protein [Bacteroidales bacterium]